MPQVADRCSRNDQINDDLENCAGWPMLCNMLRPMRTPLCDPKTREKEVREFPMILTDLG